MLKKHGFVSTFPSTKLAENHQNLSKFVHVRAEDARPELAESFTNLMPNTAKLTQHVVYRSDPVDVDLLKAKLDAIKTSDTDSTGTIVVYFSPKGIHTLPPVTVKEVFGEHVKIGAIGDTTGAALKACLQEGANFVADKPSPEYLLKSYKESL